MKCLTCGENMECYDDINDDCRRIDFVKCPKCGSKAIITYSSDGYKSSVHWSR